MKDITELIHKIVDGVARILEAAIGELYNILFIGFTFLLPIFWYGMHYMVDTLADKADREIGRGTDFMIFIAFLLTWFCLLGQTFNEKREK
jgi:hypothetical protein